MVKKQEIPLILFMVFTLVYATIGDPNSEFWSGAYFIVNYLTMLVLFHNYKSKVIRITGISLSLSVLIFIIAKYFVGVTMHRYYTMIPFLICLIGIIMLEKRKTNNTHTNWNEPYPRFFFQCKYLWRNGGGDSSKFWKYKKHDTICRSLNFISFANKTTFN